LEEEHEVKRNFWINLCISLIVFSQTIIPGLAAAETTAETKEQSYIQLTGKVTDQTTVIKGTTLPNVSLKVENNEGILSNTQTDAEGIFEAPITKQPANTLLTVTVVDGNNTYSILVKVAATGWVEEIGRWYYYGPDGEKLTGWITDKGGTFYLDQTGAMVTGWLFDQGRWYFLKNNGAMQTGWLYNGGKWYLLAPSGEMKTGWQFEAGAWYYLNRSGQMQTGWLKDNNRWYYLASNGVMKTGWVYYGRSWYYLGQNGVMTTGWVYDAGKWYFMNTDGTMKKGWVQSGKDRFYLGSSGSVSSVLLDVPLVAQMPELPRGCEVTSLAMLLMDAGKNVSKMTLASQVRKDPTSYSKSNGQVYFGNPYSGFVGDMYTFSKPGLGVYHGPIADLANQYLPGRVDDFTGSDFEAIYKQLNNGRPVWVINNTLFDTVPSQYWQTWNTPSGKISITYKEHSVLITGYDSQYIYFNDPLSVTKNRKATISAFKRGWVQMGKQAITYR
jgi:glucan-binding YG repeat protein